jgi:hypothetical protein
MVLILALCLTLCTIIHTCNAIDSAPLWKIRFQGRRTSKGYLWQNSDTGKPSVILNKNMNSENTNAQMVVLWTPDMDASVLGLVRLIPIACSSHRRLLDIHEVDEQSRAEC